MRIAEFARRSRRPVPDDLAGQLAARFPGLTLRTEPAHQGPYGREAQEVV